MISIEYKALLESNILTQEEFDRKKEKLPPVQAPNV